MKYKIIDLFAGLGGFRLAFEKQECECVFSSEIDKSACETYKENFGEYPSGDITQISTYDIPNFDILCAGFPCQPFSIGGRRLGFEDSRGTLFFEVARILKYKKPKAFILENVKGLVNHEGGNTLKTIENILDELGYDFSYKVMNALDYGVPQNRERWYCIGFKKELKVSFENKQVSTQNVFKFPKKKELNFFIEDVIKEKEIKGYKSTDRAIQNINTHLPKFIEKNGRNEDRFIIANEIRPSRCSFRNNGTVPCFTAKMGTGGNNVPVIVDYYRKLTEKECLRLMGFPLNYKIKLNCHQSYKQIGNSVVVTIIEELAKNIVEMLKKVE
ncbi:DNA (cytosine-5-)-methyltransferase [Clostridium novyi]|uniref:DNA cytosine methyltransferase n=1 Tax=Clostridium novyi TaxID=1542 RepID=UPI000EA2B371|nr:DNA cytosine methyltransferase [Clostridium novyi]AYF54539.1 DNA (cytosine-5-)-methyltransferase [Clostridium novyi]